MTTTTMKTYTSLEACRLSGATTRQLDYWYRNERFDPDIECPPGSGHRRRYTLKDVLVIGVLRCVTDAVAGVAGFTTPRCGLSHDQSRVVAQAVEDLWNAGVVSSDLHTDGFTVTFVLRPGRAAILINGETYVGPWVETSDDENFSQLVVDITQVVCDCVPVTS